MKNLLALKKYNHSKNVNCLISLNHQREEEINKRISSLLKSIIGHWFLKSSETTNSELWIKPLADESY